VAEVRLAFELAECVQDRVCAQVHRHDRAFNGADDGTVLPTVVMTAAVVLLFSVVCGLSVRQVDLDAAVTLPVGVGVLVHRRAVLPVPDDLECEVLAVDPLLERSSDRRGTAF
jgi:hypothetical protein